MSVHRIPAWAARGLVAATAAAAALAATPAAAAPPARTGPNPPAEGWNYAITLDNGVDSSKAGDELTYRVTLRNTGHDAPTPAEVELTLPVGASSLAVDNGGESPEPWFAHWKITVPAGGETTMTARFRAGAPIKDANGYAATACFVRNYARLVCATDMDQLPGAASIHGAASSGSGWATLAWALPMVGAGALLGLFLARRTRKRRAAAAAGTGRHREEEPAEHSLV